MSAPPSAPKKVFTPNNVPHLTTGHQILLQRNSTSPSTPPIVNVSQQNSTVSPPPITSRVPVQTGTDNGNYAESVVSTSTNPSDCTSSTCSVTSSLIEREQQAVNRLANQLGQAQDDVIRLRIIAENCQEEGHKTCSCAHTDGEHVVPQHR
uniref:Uncharacterized protein n=1 Tax=Panagrellus redivivus TaxID=6233 RepID=A0A7E4ZSP5_PANRE